MNLLDIHDQELARSRRKRDDAITRADDHALDEWKEAMFAIIRHLALTRAEFTSDDVMKAYEKDLTIPPTHDSRALGALMLRAARENLIRNTRRYVQSVRRHATPIPVWESLVYEVAA